jgi:phage baseplate assembly protein W
MRRSFGSDLDKSLFAPSDITLIGAVRDAIQTVARKWVSTISITALSVSIKHAEVSINVRFALASNASTERERLLVVPRQRAIQFLSAATR